MKLYDLKHNGYTFGQKRGKFNAVQALKKHLSFNGIAEEKQQWLRRPDQVIVVNVGNEYDCFTIEENKG